MFNPFGPSAQSTPVGTSVQQNQNQADEISVSVVDRFMLAGKTAGNNVRFVDLEKAHNDVIRLEDGVNRSIRALNRKVNNAVTALQTLSDETNLGFQTVATRVDQCVERLDQLGGKPPKQPINQNQNNPPPNNHQNLQQQNSNNSNLSSHSSLHLEDGREDDQKTSVNEFLDFDEAILDLDEPIWHTINGLTHEGLPPLEVYSDDNIVSFDKWAQKFKERINAFGGKLNDEEKVARLAIFLDDTPKQIFDRLPDTSKQNVAMAIDNIRKELDSPQRGALSAQALSMCRQRDEESVKDFITRLRPLALAAVADLPSAASTQKERQLGQILVERLRPNISLCMKMLNFQQKSRTFEELCMDAREVEIMLSANSGPTNFNSLFTAVQTVDPIQQTSTNPLLPAGNFRTLAPTNPNHVQPQNGWRNNRNFGSNQNRQWRSGGFNNNNRSNNRWPQNPRNDRRWNQRPICNYCNKGADQNRNDKD